MMADRSKKYTLIRKERFSKSPPFPGLKEHTL